MLYLPRRLEQLQLLMAAWRRLVRAAALHAAQKEVLYAEPVVIGVLLAAIPYLKSYFLSFR
jgi:hypothetical protein